jgi:hypothetical protein
MESGKVNEQIAGIEPQSNVRIFGFDRYFSQPAIRSITINQVKGELKKLESYIGGCATALRRKALR